MTSDPKYKGSCHCGAVKFEVDLPDGLDDPRRCNCSICWKRGATVATLPLDGLRVTAGEEFLTLYQFNTMTAKHYFCSRCGIYTHHQRRSNPNEFAFNIACIEGVNLAGLGDVKIYDGINHPSDR